MGLRVGVLQRRTIGDKLNCQNIGTGFLVPVFTDCRRRARDVEHGVRGSRGRRGWPTPKERRRRPFSANWPESTASGSSAVRCSHRRRGTRTERR